MLILGTREAEYLRVAYGAEMPLRSREPNCPGCGVETGGLHHRGCAIEECPLCRGQVAECDCNRDGTEPAAPRPRRLGARQKREPIPHLIKPVIHADVVESNPRAPRPENPVWRQWGLVLIIGLVAGLFMYWYTFLNSSLGTANSGPTQKQRTESIGPTFVHLRRIF